MTRQPWEHDRDCLYVVTDGPAPCTCAAGYLNEPAHLPRCACGHVFAICMSPNCEKGSVVTSQHLSPPNQG
jgi:hypothetical protein